jgi:hypothetical protein
MPRKSLRNAHADSSDSHVSRSGVSRAQPEPEGDVNQICPETLDLSFRQQMTAIAQVTYIIHPVRARVHRREPGFAAFSH